MLNRQLTIFHKILLSLLTLAIIPVLIASFVAVRSIHMVGDTAEANMEEIGSQIHRSAELMRLDITADSILQHDVKSTLAIETRTRDIAGQVASFLYSIDATVLSLQAVQLSPQSLLKFYKAQQRYVVNPQQMQWDELTGTWVAVNPSPVTHERGWKNEKNKASWSYNPPLRYNKNKMALFKEITFFDVAGQEVIKIKDGGISSDLRDISHKENTFVRSEVYFSHIENLEQGELYVSPVIGAYQPFWGGVPGVFDPTETKKNPLEYAYAGRENPLGARFDGLIRWVMPVFENGQRTGFISCALDHRHLQDLLEHIHPTPETYTQHPDGGSGNYAFLWDNHSRSIVHPRHYFICGYDSKTGKSIPGWTGATKKEQLQNGLIPLDCNTLDFAPQCQGWKNITAEGGNGSFQIFWSGLTKLTTVATVDYHTGTNYDSARGFGYVTIGAHVNDFHKPALASSEMIQTAIDTQRQLVDQAVTINKELIAGISGHTSLIYIFLTVISCFAVVIVAYYVSRNITLPLHDVSMAVRSMGQGKYQTIGGDAGGEIGDLVSAFNNMVAERQSVATKLLENESKYRNLFETSPNGIIICHDKKVYDCNDETVNIFRVASKRHIIGKSPGDLSVEFQASGEGSDTAIDVFLADVFEIGFKKIDWLFQRMDGEPFYAEIWASSFVHQGQKMIHATIRDVTERKKGEEQVELAKMAAEEANQAKSIFLANMSHEIRTPMNGVMGMASILGKTRLDSNQQRCVELMNSSAKRLLRILNDILDFAQIESGKLGLTQHVFNVRTEMEHTLGMLSVAAEEKNIIFKVDIEKNVPEKLYGDAGRIAQVLINIVMNGIKFTPAGGEVAVSVKCKPVTNSSGSSVGLFLNVSDTGVGIPIDKQDIIFKPFTQADVGHARSFGGSGLGLAITAELVAMMNGRIDVDSQEGVGTVFDVYLPLGLVEYGVDTDLDVVDGVPVDTNGVLRGCSVLLVEDEVVNQIVIKEMLKVYGVVFDTVDNGSASLMKTRVRRYDLILLDVQLPDYDGYSVAKHIRHDSGALNQKTPIIGVASKALVDVKDKCLAAGMAGFVEKPIGVNALVKEMLRVL